MAKIGKKKQELSILAQRIRSARLSAHLSQATLSNGIGVSDKSVSSYEKGRSIPPLETLQKIAQETHHPLTYFTDESPDEQMILHKLAKVEHDLEEIKKLLKKGLK